jgi:hypothetical protein
MRTGTVAVQRPRGRHSLLRLVAVRAGFIGLTAFAMWSISGRVEAAVPGSPTCTVDPSASTLERLTGQACPPEGFAAKMGYEPVLVETPYGWRYIKPSWAGGFCSPPLTDRGPSWDFRSPCRTHDYGYDLVRFGAGNRAAADALLYRDMMASCGGSVDGTLCRAVARWANTALRVGDATGFDPEPIETGSGWSTVGAPSA